VLLLLLLLLSEHRLQNYSESKACSLFWTLMKPLESQEDVDDDQ
jgi:hypothetical protein